MTPGPHWSRRRFLASGLTVLGASSFSSLSRAQPASSSPRRYRAAIIGHTGGGDYGHGYDLIFQGMENVSVEALADPNTEGRRKAMERTGARRGYADFREMLAKEKPQLVSIAMRHPRSHREIALAAIEAGASLFLEKPLTETLEDADAIVRAAEARGVKVVVAHNRRYTSDFAKVKRLLAQGFVGRVREVRIQGKQDARAGGEDMIVLGTHDFDLMRFYFGDPRWCFGCVSQQGQEVTRQQARQGREPIRVAGDTVRAQFAFAHNVQLTWHSVSIDDGWNTGDSKREKWAFEILGTQRIIAYQAVPGFVYLDSPHLLPSDGPSAWRPLPEPAGAPLSDHERHMGRDLIHAIETDTQPVCSGSDGRWAVEMVSAVYQSHFRRARVELPLADRSDPLA